MDGQALVLMTAGPLGKVGLPPLRNTGTHTFELPLLSAAQARSSVSKAFILAPLRMLSMLSQPGILKILAPRTSEEGVPLLNQAQALQLIGRIPLLVVRLTLQ